MCDCDIRPFCGCDGDDDPSAEWGWEVDDFDDFVPGWDLGD